MAINFDEFNRKLQQMAQDAGQAPSGVMAKEVESAALLFVDNNFRNQEWEGTPWKSSGEGNTILVKSGALRRGFAAERKPGEIRIFNDMPYAKAHNEGFEGTVSVKAHTRGRYTKGKRGKKTRTGKVDVSPHTRKMKLDRRQFAPYPGRESATLNQTVTDILIKHYNQIFKL